MRITRALIATALFVGSVAGTTVLDEGVVPATPASAAGPFEISAWAPDFSANVEPALAAHVGDLSEVTAFLFHITPDGAIAYTSDKASKLMPKLRTAAQNAGKPLIATIFDDLPKLGMAGVLADPAQRAAHVAALVDFAVNFEGAGFSGLDLDYETFAFEDGQSSWSTTRASWGAFVTELGAALHANGKTLQVSVPPIYGGGTTPKDGYWVYNYAAMRDSVDRIKVMMYSYSPGSPSANAPYDWVQKTMTYLASASSPVSPSQVVLGLGAYGSDWVTKIDGSCPASGLPSQALSKRSLTTGAAASAASRKGVVPTRDAAGRENRYDFVESFSGPDTTNATVRCNVYRTAWYEDEQSLYERTLLAKNLGLAGVAIWALGYEGENGWAAIKAGRDGNLAYTPPVPLAPAVQSPAVVPPYPQPINSAGPLPARYLDTRPGYKTADGLFQGGGVRSADSTLELQIAGRGPVPGSATAVVLNVTAIGGGTGYVTVYPCGARPQTSSLNVGAGQTISNSVVTKLSSEGSVCLYTQQAAQLIVDVFGVLPAGAVDALDVPARLADTRPGQSTSDGLVEGTGALDVNGVLTVQVAGRGGVDANATAAVLNVTAVDAVGDGFLTVWPCDAPQPTASNVNYARSAAIPNAVVTGLSADGTVCIYSSNETHVVVDVFGEPGAGTFAALPTAGRLAESRAGYTTIDGKYNAMGKSTVNQVSEIPVVGRAGITAAPDQVVLNVTVVAPETAGYVTVYPCGVATPLVSNVNFAAGQTIPNLVITPLSPTGTVCVYTSTKTHVIVDVFGTLELG